MRWWPTQAKPLKNPRAHAKPTARNLQRRSPIKTQNRARQRVIKTARAAKALSPMLVPVIRHQKPTRHAPGHAMVVSSKPLARPDATAVKYHQPDAAAAARRNRAAEWKIA